MDINEMISLSGKVAFVGMVIMFIAMVMLFPENTNEDVENLSKVIGYVGGIICVIGIIAMFSYGIYSMLM